MEKDWKDSVVKEPDITYGNYTYADYLRWDTEETVELIKGKVFKKAAATPHPSMGRRKSVYRNESISQR